MEGKVPVGSPAKETFVAGELMRQYFGMQEPVACARIVQWWYRLTAPAEGVKRGNGFSKGNSFSQNLLQWRGRLASALLFFFLLAFLALVLPLIIFTINLPVIPVASLLLFIALVAIAFNRAGKPQIAGLLITVSLAMGVCSLLLTNPGGLGVDTLSLFDLLVFSELFVASLLPVKWVILVAFLNSIFVAVAMFLMPKTPELAYVMQKSAYTLLLRPVSLYFIVAGVLCLWIGSAMRAMKRAEQAEQIATHQYMLAMQEHVTARQKHLLDAGIEQIMQTFVQVANGDLKARVPLKEGALLWPLAIALNNMLSRIQRLQRTEQEFLQMLPCFQKGKLAEYELQRVSEEVKLLKLIIQDARQTKHCVHAVSNGTLLDPLIQELNGQYLSPLPPYIRNSRNTSALILPHPGGDDTTATAPESGGGAL